MRFTLDARFIFSKNIEGADARLEEVLESANTELLLRGVPRDSTDRKRDGAQVVSWKLDGQSLSVHITSGPFVRAHDAVLRLRKHLGQEIGREFKVGIRQVFIDSYAVVFDLPNAPREPLHMPFASDLKVEGKTCTLVLKDVSEELLEKNAIDRMITRLSSKAQAQEYQGKAEFWELMESHGQNKAVWQGEPTEEMLERGWLKQGPTKGKWFFRPQAAAIMRAMQELAVEEFLRPLGFHEIIESHIVPFDVWIKTGHMEGVPNEIYYVSEPKTRDQKAWEAFIDHVDVMRSVPADMFQDLLNPPSAGVCYAQCPLIYWSLQGETVADSSLPILIYDRTANSMRYESGGRHGIERVDEFHRIEPVYIGRPEQLIELREKMLERYRHIFNNILELEWRMAWVTPFYMQQSGQIMGDEDKIQRSKGTMDFEAYLPYRGSREEAEWLEFQNLSIMGDKYTSTFNIKPQSGGELWSGCSGIGIERWTAAFLAQKGLDPERWPDAFRKRLGKLPDGIKLL